MVKVAAVGEDILVELAHYDLIEVREFMFMIIVSICCCPSYCVVAIYVVPIVPVDANGDAGSGSLVSKLRNYR